MRAYLIMMFRLIQSSCDQSLDSVAPVNRSAAVDQTRKAEQGAGVIPMQNPLTNKRLSADHAVLPAIFKHAIFARSSCKTRHILLFCDFR